MEAKFGLIDGSKTLLQSMKANLKFAFIDRSKVLLLSIYRLDQTLLTTIGAKFWLHRWKQNHFSLFEAKRRHLSKKSAKNSCFNRLANNRSKQTAIVESKSLIESKCIDFGGFGAPYMPTFKIQGQVYHSIGSLREIPGQLPMKRQMGQRYAIGFS